MTDFTLNIKKFKTGVIKQFEPFLKQGLITAKEIEFIAEGAVVANLDSLKVNK